MKKILRPFEKVSKSKSLTIQLVWLLFILVIWSVYSLGDRHMFPTLSQVGEGFVGLWNEGLVTHLFSSIWLCLRAVIISIVVALFFAYSTTIPVLKPIGKFISSCRYLPLAGVAFYITIILSSGRDVQIGVLVIFMTTYLITSLISMLNDIEDREFDHARALGCSRWEILWEVVIKGRFDHVVEIIRQNLAIVWMMLVTVESIMVASGGLGFLIKNSDKLGNHGRIVALQIVILLVGVGMDTLITKFRKITFRYSKI